VSELAAFTVGTETFIMELLAFLRLVFVVNRFLFDNDLLVAVSKLALIAVAAETLLNPVLAHLCFELSFVYFSLLTID
jgi:hypothetical protein